MPVEVADGVQDVAQARGVESNDERLAGGRVQHGRRRRGPRALAQLLDGRLGSRGFDAIADRLIERDDLGGGLAVGRVVLARQPVLAPRRFQLILGLEGSRLVEMRPRGGEQRAFERDLVVGIVRRRLSRGAIVRHSLIEVAGLHGGVAVAERPRRGASRSQARQGDHGDYPAQPSRHRALNASCNTLEI